MAKTTLTSTASSCDPGSMAIDAAVSAAGTAASRAKTGVGTVDSIGVDRRDDGTSIALLGLKMERSVDPLPIDSTLLIRPRSFETAP